MFLSSFVTNKPMRALPSATSANKKASRLARASGGKTTIRSSTSTTSVALPTKTSTTSKRSAPVARASPAPSPPADVRRRVVILPGLGNSDSDYEDLADLLRERGAAVRVARVSRLDWARNAAGLLRPEYWTGKLAPRPTVDWYLGRIDEALKLLDEEAGSSSPLTLLAHSAGGWLGRVWMLSESAGEDGAKKTNASLVSSFVSVGSPHNPPPPSSSIPDQTRGILTWCERETPGAFHADEHGVRYTTIAAKYVKGAPLFGGASGGDDDGDGGGALETRATIAQRLAGFGYEAVCGDPTAWGDGIVPVETAHLRGATTVTLDGVYHSPLGADESESEESDGEEESKSKKKKRPWYGSEGVLDLWVDAVFGERPLAAVAEAEKERAL